MIAHDNAKFQYLRPCPICGSRDGRCRKKGSLYFCMEYANGEAANETWKYRGITKDWNWGIYSLWNEHDWKKHNTVEPKGFSLNKQPVTSHHKTRTEKHRYFKWLLSKAPLTEEDRQILLNKGLHDSEITPSIFGSCHGGILITFPDVYGHKIAAQVRRRNTSTGNRYYWHTSKKHPNNKLENDQMPISVWKTISSDSSTVNICEGYLKSYIVSCQYRRINQDQPWIGIGAASYLNSAFQEIAKTIRVLKPQIIRFYPDAGSADNPNVCRHYQRFWQSLKSTFPTLKIEIASWKQEFSKNAPDLDELEDKSIIKFIPLKEYEITFQNQEAYPQQERLQFWKNKLKEHKYLLDSSPTGTGKSHTAGEFDEPAVYISTDHRNPDVQSIKEWADTEARHGGLAYDQHGYLRRNELEPQIPSNCHLHRAHQQLRENGHKSSFLCFKCEHFENCQKELGNGYGYLYQRKLALSAKQLRIHPDSLPQIDKFNYEQRTLIIEEAGEIPMVSQLVVHKSHIAKAISLISESLTLSIETKENLTKYLQQLSEAVDKYFGKKYGAVNDIPPPSINTNIQLSLWSLCDPEADLNDEIATEEWNSASGSERYKLNQINNLLKKTSTDAEWISRSLSNKLNLGIFWLILGHSSWISERGTIHVYRVKSELREIIKKAKNVIFLDATANRDKIALIYGLSPEEIHQVSCIIENEPNNLTIEQVSDLGKLCRQRGKEQSARLKELIKACKSAEPKTRVIDLLEHTEDGCWWRDSRGRNTFSDCQQLILVGLPARNLLHSLVEFITLGGNPAMFQHHYNELIQADIIQGIGRLRSHRRLDEQLKILIVTSFPLPKIVAKQVKSIEIAQKAAPKVEQKIAKIAEIYQELEQNNIKPTQKAIAERMAIARETVCRCWKKVKEALEKLKHKPVRVCDNSELAIHEQALGIIETFEEFQECSPKEHRMLTLYALNEIPTDEDALGTAILSRIYDIKGINWLTKLEQLIDSS